MSYHEKRAIVSMASSVVLTGAYSILIYFRYLAGDWNLINDPHFWGTTFVVFITLSVVARIFIMIGFVIYYRITTHENAPSFSDERDKLIELKGSRNALYTFSIGLILSMASLVIYLPLFVMFIMVVYSGLMASLGDDITQFYLYRKGS